MSFIACDDCFCDEGWRKNNPDLLKKLEEVALAVATFS
jgi:hypothetical protein